MGCYAGTDEGGTNFKLPIIKWMQSHITIINPIPAVMPQNTYVYKLNIYMNAIK